MIKKIRSLFSRIEPATRWACAYCTREGAEGTLADHLAVCPVYAARMEARCRELNFDHYPGLQDTAGANGLGEHQSALEQMQAARAPHNAEVMPQRAGMTSVQLLQSAGDSVPALAKAMTTIAQRFEDSVVATHQLNTALGEFKENFVVPLREELKHIRYNLGGRIGHVTTDLEKYVTHLDRVLWGALRAQGLSDDQIRSFRTEHGMEPEAPKSDELELQLMQSEEMRQQLARLTRQNRRLIAKLDGRHEFKDSEQGEWDYHGDCVCIQCQAHRDTVIGMDLEASDKLHAQNVAGDRP